MILADEPEERGRGSAGKSHTTLQKITFDFSWLSELQCQQNPESLWDQ